MLGLNALSAKMLLKKSDKIKWEASSLATIKHNALEIAMSLEVVNDEYLDGEKERI